MRILERLDDTFWWEVARACDYATFFHTPLWHGLAVETFRRCRDVSIGAELDNGVRAVFPLLERRDGPLGRMAVASSTFAGCYGGPIADGPLSAGDRDRLFHALAAGSANQVLLTGNPLAGPQAPPHGFDAGRDVTHLLELDEPFDALFARFSKGHRSATTKGRRLGVTTRVATSVEDYRAYYRTYRDSLARWGETATSRYPWRLFEHGARLARAYPEHLALWLAEHKRRVVGGAWVFYWNRHAVYWHGAGETARRSLSATNVLLADVIADACRRGLRWFDFNPSGSHEGVAAFKRRFGAKPVPLERWEARAAHSSLRRPARRLARGGRSS